uniref:G-protein coupled receptor Mth n=2 Tax=Cacopsylla melanoneura TaxID=428564 RepID=A0A8D8TNT9_9HEMI
MSLVFIFLILLFSSLGLTTAQHNQTLLKKCCSKSRVLNDNLECVQLVSDERFETDIFAIAGYGDVSYNNQPLCPGNVTLVRLVNNFENDSIYCVDKLISEEGKGREELVGLSCVDTPLKEQVYNVQIFTIQKCCPRYYHYNRLKQCVYLAGIDYSEKLVNSLFTENNFDKIQFINMRYGIKETKNRSDVVNDYESLRSKTNYLSSESVKVVYQSKVIDGNNFKGAKFNERIIPFDHACIDIVENNTEHYVVRLYEPYSKVCPSKKCVRKCCRPGYTFVNGKRCEKSNHVFAPRFNIDIHKGNLYDNHTAEDYAVSYGLPNCSNTLTVNFSRAQHYIIYSDGSIQEDDLVARDIEHACVEHVYMPQPSYNYNYLKPFVCSIYNTTGYALNDSAFKYQLITVLLIISTLFAFATLIVYTLLPSLHKNIHGKCLMCYFICVCLFCSVISAVRINPTFQRTNKSLCVIMGNMAHYSTLATVTWLNVICFDIWNKFRNIRAKHISESYLKKFILYSVYGWGLPALITLIMFMAQHYPDWFQEHNRPNFGVENCWFEAPSKNLSFWIFHIVPLTTFIAINIILFSFTAYHCTNTKNQIQRMKLKVLDTALHIECPLYQGPMLPRDYSPTMPIVDQRIKRICHKIQPHINTMIGFSDRISFNVLPPFLPMSDIYVIDVLVHPSFMGRTMFKMNLAQDNLYTAILVHIPEHFCSDGQLIGAQAMRIRHLKSKGFKVVTLEHKILSKLVMYPKELINYISEQMQK